MEMWEAIPRAAEIKKKGEIVPNVSRHKKDILPIGDVRYVLETC